MSRESLFYIPCLCGREVRSHEREAACEACGRWLVVEWGTDKPPRRDRLRWALGVGGTPAEVRREESQRADPKGR